MTTWWVATIVCLVLPAAQPTHDQTGTQPAARSEQAAQSGQTGATARSGRELMAACRAALRRWARPGGEQLQPAAVELLGLYHELQQDTELAVSQREGLRLVVRRRLLTLAQQLERQAATRRREVAAQDDAPQLQAPPTVKAAQQMGVLAQQGPWPGMRPGAGMVPRGIGPGMMPRGMMGPGMMGPMGANQPMDAGEQLADLIRQTVAPDMWIENGGPGSIYYWWPGRALVVRQTDEVHEQIADLLEQLQRAGN